MPRKNWKASDYDPITKKRISKKWSDEKLKQIRKELKIGYKFNKERN